MRVLQIYDITGAVSAFGTFLVECHCSVSKIEEEGEEKIVEMFYRKKAPSCKCFELALKSISLVSGGFYKGEEWKVVLVTFYHTGFLR